MDRDRDCFMPDDGEMFHDHEVVGSVQIAEERNNGDNEDNNGEDAHTHRFATISSQAICKDRSHFHVVETRTDFFEDHFHKIRVITGLAVPVGDGRHVHFAESVTSFDEGHRHEFRLSTQIEDPIGEEKRR